MRQFILGAKVAYATGTDLSKVPDGAVGFFYNKDGVPTVTATGKEITSEAMIVLGRSAEKGGPIVLPFFKNNFSYVKSDYIAATKFSAVFTINAPKKAGDYSIIIVRKGTKFNERNKWTVTVRLNSFDDSGLNDESTLAGYFVKQINKIAIASGITAAQSSRADVTVTAEEAGVDYEIIAADELSFTISKKTQGIPAYGDAKYVQDLAEKAAADAGFEYTYSEDCHYLYPNYPLNPLKQSDAADTGFTIFTLRFAEPRDVKTRDEVVNQIIQVAFPTETPAIAIFETVCKALAGEALAGEVVSTAEE
jgi:hypothetical protein